MVRPSDGVSFSSFRGVSGDAEHYITVEAPADADLPRQLDSLAGRYAEALQALNLPPTSAIFRRLYVSDAPNQAPLIRSSRLHSDADAGPVAVSMVQQAPLRGAKVALLAYHLSGPSAVAKRAFGPQHLIVEKGAQRHLWSTQLCAGDDTGPGSAVTQTHDVFDQLVAALHANGATLARHCVRTWIYVKDVDVFYEDMVAARSALFERHGMTRDTHYLASTGIEGACEHRYDLVYMDAYSILDLAPEQMSYLNAYDRLCATKDYNVTFERGTRIGYADRAHHFISGTASIDAGGKVVHVGDVGRQLERALGNVDALLRSGGARLQDMTHFIVYLRDPSDHPRIEAYFAERFPEVPRLIVHGPVCRPEWLVEVEGVAAVASNAPTLPAF